jgi:hypothetical protein
MNFNTWEELSELRRLLPVQTTYIDVIDTEPPIYWWLNKAS